MAEQVTCLPGVRRAPISSYALWLWVLMFSFGSFSVFDLWRYYNGECPRSEWLDLYGKISGKMNNVLLSLKYFRIKLLNYGKYFMVAISALLGSISQLSFFHGFEVAEKTSWNFREHFEIMIRFWVTQFHRSHRIKKNEYIVYILVPYLCALYLFHYNTKHLVCISIGIHANSITPPSLPICCGWTCFLSPSIPASIPRLPTQIQVFPPQEKFWRILK